MIIAVDFDGTIVENKYPYIGKELPLAIKTLKRLQSDGHLLILWTVRSGKSLEDAITFCQQHGIEFYAVNRNYPEEIDIDVNQSRKINADFFIDDRNVGGLPDWDTIYKMITTGLSYKELAVHLFTKRRKWPFHF